MDIGVTSAWPISFGGRSSIRFSTSIVGGNATSFVDVVVFEAIIHGLGVLSVDHAIFSSIVTLVSVRTPMLEDNIAIQIAHTIADFS